MQVKRSQQRHYRQRSLNWSRKWLTSLLVVRLPASYNGRRVLHLHVETRTGNSHRQEVADVVARGAPSCLVQCEFELHLHEGTTTETSQQQEVAGGAARGTGPCLSRL